MKPARLDKAKKCCSRFLREDLRDRPRKWQAWDAWERPWGRRVQESRCAGTGRSNKMGRDRSGLEGAHGSPLPDRGSDQGRQSQERVDMLFCLTIWKNSS